MYPKQKFQTKAQNLGAKEMFGVIVAGRPVISTFQTISPTQFAFTIPQRPPFSHIVVFLLPQNVLPPGTAAAVYLQIPPSTEFRLLGAVANEKQSAIYKVNGIARTENTVPAEQGEDDMVDEIAPQPGTDSQSVEGANIIVGISVEPAAGIEVQLALLKGSTGPIPEPNSGTELVRHQIQVQTIPTKLLAQRIIKNAFNFLSSFAGGTGAIETVPLKSFQDWWTKFEKRIDIDPGFLERDNDA